MNAFLQLLGLLIALLPTIFAVAGVIVLLRKLKQIQADVQSLRVEVLANRVEQHPSV
jgi:uncharacterized membrane protein